MLFAQAQANAAALTGGGVFAMFGVSPTELLVIGGVAVLLVGEAAILRVSCWLFNKFAGGPGSPGSVPQPNFGKACVIALVAWIVQGVASFGVGLAVGPGGAAAGANHIIAMLVSVPIAFIVFAALVSTMLPTTFGRAFGVALCNYLILFAIVVCIGIMIAVLGLATGGLGR